MSSRTCAPTAGESPREPAERVAHGVHVRGAGVREDRDHPAQDAASLHALRVHGLRVALLHVVGEADVVVPVEENSDVIEKRYRELGGSIEVIRKPGVGHHPHALKDPKSIVDFIHRHTSKALSVRAHSPRVLVRSGLARSSSKFRQEKVGHVAFIGGSITEMNGYRPMVGDLLEERFPETAFTFTAAGISIANEAASGGECVIGTTLT